ncbi:MAG: alpha,alpha-phosphotrehalase [Treponemataceae bacterium]
MSNMLNSRNKWALSIGCVGRDLCYVLVSLFLLTYLQYTGLFQTHTQFLVLTGIIFACRIWDAFNDPMMGTIIHNTNTRFGKYRPWVLIGAFTNVFFLVAMFSVRFENGWHNVAFIGTMYLFWGMTYTMNDIAYWDLLPALTSEKKQRDSLTMLVATFASLGQFTSGVIVPAVTSGNAVYMYKLIAFIWAGIFLLCQLLVFFGVHDNEEDKFILPKKTNANKEDDENKISLSGMLKTLFSNKQLLVSALAIFLYSLASSILNAFGLNFFYFKFGYYSDEFLKNGGLIMTIFTVVFGVGTLISQIIYPALAKRWKRMQLLKFALALLSFGYIGFLLASNLTEGFISVVLLISMGLLIFSGQGIMYMIFVVMLTNTIEYGEWLTGKNSSAITFTARPFMVKLAGALQYVLVVVALVISGLHPMTEKTGYIEASVNMINENLPKEKIILYLDSVNASEKIKNEYTIILNEYNHSLNEIETNAIIEKLKSQTNNILKANSSQMLQLTMFMTLLPVALFLFAFRFVKRKYKIDEKAYQIILDDLANRKSFIASKTQTDWFKDAIIYQIYPASFKDSNNDGIGDIGGIISKLDYLKDLGINCVWLSPIYVSPMKDNGYDISDYKNINPTFGTMEDFKRMLSEMHARRIKLIMDLVVNHTSNEHPWFKQSKSSKDNPYRDYYIWKKKPNNWTGFFGEKAWQYDETTGEYYLCLFGSQQPDLNWENEKVRTEVKEVCKFWLDMGVDGFRCDVINLISKEQSFKNGSLALFLVGSEYYINGPKLHNYLQELNRDVLSNYDSMTVGETVFCSLEEQILLTDPTRQELSMVFNFEHTNVDNFFGVKWLYRKFNLKRLKKTLDKFQYGLENKGWNSLFYENHDQRRSIGRFGTDEKNYPLEGAKMLANSFYFLKGTPFIYQGQELGMRNLDVKNIDEFVDIETKNVITLMKQLHLPQWFINKSIRNGSRDNARTPMQWSAKTNAGFSEATPWLTANPNYKTLNVEQSLANQNSLLKYYQKLFQVYKEHAELIRDASYKNLAPRHKRLFAYERNLGKRNLIVLSNFSGKPLKTKLLTKYESMKSKKILLNNYADFDTTNLQAYQSVVLIYEE